jgi:hypothetical protein
MPGAESEAGDVLQAYLLRNVEPPVLAPTAAQTAAHPTESAVARQ